MRRGTWMALAALLAALTLALGLTAQTARPAAKSQPLEVLVARDTKLKEADVGKVMRSLGPIINDKLRAGEAVVIPGLGTFRVVRVAEHKDLVTGLPTRIPPVNYVEFIPGAETAGSANAPGTVPNVVVPPNEFNVNPNATPGLKDEGLRTPRTRTR